MTKKPNAAPDPEIVAISDVYAALKELDPEAQARVLIYVAKKLKVESLTDEIDSSSGARPSDDERDIRVTEREAEAKQEAEDELEGVSPVAKKWISRNGLQTKELWKIFSLSTDDIDLIAKAVPGKTKKDRMRSVFLLKGIAAYLASGAARFSHQQVKETCLHYDAYDVANFATHFKASPVK